MRKRSVVAAVARASSVLAAILLNSAMAVPQQSPQNPDLLPASAADSVRELEAQIRALSAGLSQANAEMQRTRAEAAQLRQELEETRSQVAALRSEVATARSAAAAQPAAQGKDASQEVEQRLSRVEEDQQLLSSKVEDQYQTKVESTSKYRVKLSGMVLFNLFGTSGATDNLDVPGLARSPNPGNSNTSFGATVRQSLLGLELFGPEVAGAHTHADIQADFFGGFPATSNGVTLGLMRLRTGGMRFDWPQTTVVVGQYTPFFSPLSPTSIATVAYPPLSTAGNLWTWTPQIEVEHRFTLSEGSSVVLQGGILDPLTGEPPYDPYYRAPQAGERSGQPAYAARVAWTHGAAERQLTLGAGGYYARQNWGFGRTVDAWAATADWSVPLGAKFALTGEFYRGRGIGGLGAANGRSVLFNGDPALPYTLVRGLNTTGGWAQLKFKPLPKLEFNGAFGEDYPLPADLLHFSNSIGYFDADDARNESAFINGIYHVRSNLLFSLEYQHLRTAEIYPSLSTASILSLSAAFLF